jgi:hypothetical protein
MYSSTFHLLISPSLMEVERWGNELGGNVVFGRQRNNIISSIYIFMYFQLTLLNHIKEGVDIYI